VSHRPDPANFNEFVMTFFKALSPERIAYVEGSYRERRELADEFFERDGWRIERFCPHRQADLTRFGEIEGGVLTCSLHHWQFDLATGRCLTSDDRYLRCERVTDSAS
jgi:UDP-MurNAc hydroxylase